LLVSETDKDEVQESVLQIGKIEKTRLLKILGKIARSKKRFYLGAINNHLRKEDRLDSGQLKEMFTDEDFYRLGLKACYVPSLGEVEVKRIRKNDK